MRRGGAGGPGGSCWGLCGGAGPWEPEPEQDPNRSLISCPAPRSPARGTTIRPSRRGPRQPFRGGLPVKLFRVSSALALALPAGAQSFQDNTTDIPTGGAANNSTTENVSFADVDGDGDWDALFADGGDFGNDRNRIWINQGGLQSGAVGVFVDETTRALAQRAGRQPRRRLRRHRPGRRPRLLRRELLGQLQPGQPLLREPGRSAGRERRLLRRGHVHGLREHRPERRDDRVLLGRPGHRAAGRQLGGLVLRRGLRRPRQRRRSGPGAHDLRSGGARQVSLAPLPERRQRGISRSSTRAASSSPASSSTTAIPRCGPRACSRARPPTPPGSRRTWPCAA